MYSNANIPIDSHVPLHHHIFEQDRDMWGGGDNAVSQNINCTGRAYIHQRHNRDLAIRPLSYNSVIDNIKTISNSNVDALVSNIIVGSANTAVNQASTSRSNMTKILADLDNGDLLQAFILNPGVVAKSSELFEGIACKDLPLSIRQLSLDLERKNIRNMLGIIFSSLQAEDMKMFKKICRFLKSTTDDYEKESSVQRAISLLLNKYGKDAIYKQLGFFIDCCYKSWYYNNPGYKGNPSDEDVFGGNETAIYQNIHRIVNLLIVPNQELISIILDTIYLNDEFCKLGMAINTNPDVRLNSVSLTETFASVFPNTAQPLTYAFSMDDSGSMNSRGHQSFSQRLLGYFCCIGHDKYQ